MVAGTTSAEAWWSLEDAPNRLLAAPAFSTDTEQPYLKAMESAGEDAVNLLVVTMDGDADRVLQTHLNAGGGRLANLGVVSVGETTRSAATEQAGRKVLDSGRVSARIVPNPADLTGIGISISEYLHEWADDDRRTIVYVDSLTTLLQYVDTEAAYRLLHMLAYRVADIDGIGIYRLDSSAHDEQVVEALKGLCDAAMVVEADGTVRHQHR